MIDILCTHCGINWQLKDLEKVGFEWRGIGPCPLCARRQQSELKWHDDYLALVEFWAKRKSKDPSTQVACAIVRPDRTLATLGYNGFPRGVADDERLHDREKKYPIVVHGEMNALLTAREPLHGYTAYVWPMPPCSRCAACLIQAGIKEVHAPWPNDRWIADCNIGRDLMTEAGVTSRWYTKTGISVYNGDTV